MKTNVIKVRNDGEGQEAALKEAERFAVYQELNRKETLRLRLLAEEMLGMIEAIVGDFNAQFWLEGENGDTKICLEAEAWVDYDKKERLIGVSSSGKNYAQRTFMGKLAGIFEYCMMGYDSPFQQALENGYFLYDGTSGMDYERMWSLDFFREDLSQNLEDEVKRAEWDELEKSIVAKLADEVIVGVKAHKVQMIIKKNFRK